ncbi:hypothetical protein [Actinomycetospora straminea]|uniref:Uncharacterized protein n=1 Tax=Actinomycetospora straminea TaxID=663607 RepID=A0ABP9EIW4_9PSEU|nr:hypothetical protein [Actinomycetospora straminea]MDD7933851.1 hypothetical protein [Actinomycetospora straminea]
MAPDGVAVTLPSLAEVAGHRDAAVEAARRLRASRGDTAVLLAVLDGPGLLDDVKAYLDAGVDGVVVTGGVDAATARTVGNVCRFHRAMAHGPGLAAPVTRPLGAPAPSTGLVLSDECPADTDVTAVAAWLAAVRA